MTQESVPTDIRMKGFRLRHELTEMIRLIDDRIASIGTETVSTLWAAGRRLAGPVFAAVDVPGFDRAAMDGYAVRADETYGAGLYNELPFQLVGRALPGAGYAGRVERGQAVQIMTGAPLPLGADAVAVAESARLAEGVVYITEAVSPGKNVGRLGEDVRACAVLLAPPRTLRPQDIAVCIGSGVPTLEVCRQPRVAILATGNELLPAGSTPSGERIVDTNSVMLAELTTREGGQAIDRLQNGGFAILPDNRAVLRDALRSAAERADCVLLCGGSSVGVEDDAPGIVRELGELPIHGLALRPASPAGLGFVAGKPVFLMPGNPVSCLCAFDLFVGRAIRRLGGRPNDAPARIVSARLASNLSSAIGRVDYVRVRFIAPDAIEPLAIGGAAILTSTVRADGYVVVPKDLEGYPAGAIVDVALYDVAVESIFPM